MYATLSPDPINRPYCTYTATGKPPSGQLLRYALRSKGGQRSSPKLERVVFPSLRSSCSCSCVAGPPGRIPLRRVLLCSTPYRLLRGGRGTRSRVLSNGFQSPCTWDRQLELRTVRQRHTLTTTTPFLTYWQKDQLRARKRSRLCLSAQCLVQEAWTPLLASLVTADTADIYVRIAMPPPLAKHWRCGVFFRPEEESFALPSPSPDC